MGLFDSFDGDDGEPRPPRNHWLNGWRVQLPVNHSGGYSGNADQNWNPAENRSPWYKASKGRVVTCRKPDGKGAKTGGSSSTRCELNQLKKWSDGEIEFEVKVKDTPKGGTIFCQCRSGEDAHELLQARIFEKEDRIELKFHEGSEKIQVDVDTSKPVKFEAKVKRNDYFKVWINGTEYRSDKFKKNYGRNRFNWKFGVYGQGKEGAECEFENVKWSA